MYVSVCVCVFVCLCLSVSLCVCPVPRVISLTTVYRTSPPVSGLLDSLKPGWSGREEQWAGSSPVFSSVAVVLSLLHSHFCLSVLCLICHSATVPQSHSATVIQTHSATVTQSHSLLSHSATVPQCHSHTDPQSHSPSHTVYPTVP